MREQLRRRNRCCGALRHLLHRAKWAAESTACWVFTTLVFGLIGLLVTVRYQQLPPARRWESELAGYVIAAVPKIVLGMLVWAHALQPDTTVAEALTLLNITASNISSLNPTV